MHFCCDESSLFGDANGSKIKKYCRFTKYSVMKNTLSLMNIGKIVQEQF